MDEERGSRTIVKTDVTNGELDVGASGLPSVELLTKKNSEVADSNEAGPASAGKLRIHSSLKQPQSRSACALQGRAGQEARSSLRHVRGRDHPADPQR